MNKSTHSTALRQEFNDYMIESGYAVNPPIFHNQSWITLVRGTSWLNIAGDSISYMEYDEGEREVAPDGEISGRMPEFHIIASFNGLNIVNDITSFALLLDIMGAVSIKQNLRSLTLKTA
jgi:hypothetical protein